MGLMKSKSRPMAPVISEAVVKCRCPRKATHPRADLESAGKRSSPMIFSPLLKWTSPSHTGDDLDKRPPEKTLIRPTSIHHLFSKS